MKRKVWSKIFSMAAVILTSVSNVCNFVSAETLPSCSESKIVKKNCANKFHVKNEEELLNYLNKAQDADTVILENDITLKTIAEIKTSIFLDLNGHQIFVKNQDFIEDKNCMKLVEGVIKIRKTNLPHIEDVDKLPSLSPKHNEVAKCYVKYDDNLKVTIKNGTIKRENGKAVKTDAWLLMLRFAMEKTAILPILPSNFIAGRSRCQISK